jgi:hypothetical protein
LIVRGRFIGDAPHFAVHLRGPDFEGMVWMLADTGASRTILLDCDVRSLRIPARSLEPSSLAIVGIRGSMRSFSIRAVEVTWASDEGDVTEQLPLAVAQHDLDQLPPAEASRILRLPSVLGRDLLNRFRFTCDYRSGTVRLERSQLME